MYFIRFVIAVILLCVVDRVLGASVNITDSVLAFKNATKLENSTKPLNESVQPSHKIGFAEMKLLKKLGFNVTSALPAVNLNKTLNSTSDDFSHLKNTSMGGRAAVRMHLPKHKLKANMTHGNVSSTSSHLNSTGNSTSDVHQMKNSSSKIVERGVFVVMFDNKQALLDIANSTAEDIGVASDFSLPMNSSSMINGTEFDELLNKSINSNSSASLGEL